MLWKRHIVFLEQDISIQQQKIIINESSKSRDQKQQDFPQRIHIATVKVQLYVLVMSRTRFRVNPHSIVT